MSACDTFANWEIVGAGSERIEDLLTITDELLQHWGIDSVDIEFGEITDADTQCKYDAINEKIVFDTELTGEASALDSFDCIFHESIHAAQHHSGILPTGFMNELEAQSISSTLLQDFLDNCTSDEFPESGAGSNLPDHPWLSVL